MTLGSTRRNQSNAQHSTGPKSDVGKARSSQNARTHGATSTPSASEVTSWLKVILNKDTLTNHDLKPRTFSGQCALELAISEARLAITEQARRDRGEEDWQAKTVNTLVKEIIDNLRMLLDELPDEKGLISRDPEAAVAAAVNAADSLNQAMAAVEAQKHRLTWRYQREAQARRRRALKEWGRALEEEHEFSRRCSQARLR
jgi:hypothetical protein